MPGDHNRHQATDEPFAQSADGGLTRRASLFGVGIVAGTLAVGSTGAHGQPRSGKITNPQADLSAFAQEQIDTAAIQQLVLRERRARDMQEWDELAASYTPDSMIDMSWFKGTGAEFARASAKMAAGGLLTFHETGPTFTQIVGNRALGDTGMTLHVVREIGGANVDITGYIRSRTRLERQQNGSWLMAGFRSIYIHDLIVPLDPSQNPKIDSAALKGFRPSYRYLSYVLSISGHPISNDLAGIDRPGTVKALIAGEEAWLRAA